MKVHTNLDHLPEFIKPVFLTIGNFDGVHLGHRTILKNLQEGAAKEQLHSCVITFSNHPSSILRPNHPIPLLTSKEHKLKLLEKIGIDHVLMLDFDLAFSNQSAETFLTKVHTLCPFRRLILGANAKLGNDRQGNTPLMQSIANQKHFTLEFLPLESTDHDPITSSRIRAAIQCAELKKAASLLGRKYSIMGEVIHGKGEGHKLGYPTLNLSLEDLCHPPLGVYPVTVTHDQKIYNGIANVGIAPTIRTDHIPLLEVHLLNQTIDLYGQIVEVTFEDFFRPERTFGSRKELIEQIESDVKQAKTFFNTSKSVSSNYDQDVLLL